MTSPGGVDVEIRWPDVDAFGHVSHMALVTIAEHGRSRWFDAVLQTSTWPYVVVHLELDYRATVGFSDRIVRCEFKPVQIGRSSVRLRERFLAPDDRLVMEADSVVVAWDEELSRSRPLLEEEAVRLRMLTEGVGTESYERQSPTAT